MEAHMKDDSGADDFRLADVLEFLIRKGPGRTEHQLAEAIFGPNGYQQRVNQDCVLLHSRGRAKRQGGQGPLDPYTYWPGD